MKGAVTLLVLVLLIGLGAWLLFFQPSEPDVNTPVLSEDTAKEQLKSVEPQADEVVNKSQLTIDSELTSNQAESSISDEQRAQQLAEAKAKLDALILEYNEHLTDPESRAETQAQIETLLKQYNELALPIALAKINEN